MARLGHSTTAVAMRYQHATQNRDEVIAALLGNAIDAAAPVVHLQRNANGIERPAG